MNAYNWKEFIDQLNAVHQANNLPTNFTYSDTLAVVRSKYVWSGMGQYPVSAGGSACRGCTSPVTPPSPTQDPDINPDEGAGETMVLEPRYLLQQNMNVQMGNVYKM